ncbi:hypothetical protein J2S00_002875 [Caldalkalibacillus uzonensis]|uniref:Cupin 2 conserved barrel domain-containing protein n=1 Tax=Caldalkalibacillus uzonensis TaxID=353224 RepID=A0ABU0CX33_9BACI|nr:cupin domain-containing protein [Caldalkalibacillus uzonensis]MDQ0340080.1 hypothetical protein [Caldalkalibacillus uzonensis]
MTASLKGLKAQVEKRLMESLLRKSIVRKDESVVDGETYELHTHEAIRFRADKPHRCKNPTASQVALHFVIIFMMIENMGLFQK